MEVEKTPPPCPEKKTRAAKFFVLFYWAPSVRDVRFKLEPTLKGIKNLINHNQLNKHVTKESIQLADMHQLHLSSRKCKLKPKCYVTITLQGW